MVLAVAYVLLAVVLSGSKPGAAARPVGIYDPYDADGCADCVCHGKALCEVRLSVAREMKQPLMLQYQLDSFYQNHRRYLNSVSHAQLSRSPLEQQSRALDYEVPPPRLAPAPHLHPPHTRSCRCLVPAPHPPRTRPAPASQPPRTHRAPAPHPPRTRLAPTPHPPRTRLATALHPPRNRLAPAPAAHPHAPLHTHTRRCRAPARAAAAHPRTPLPRTRARRCRAPAHAAATRGAPERAPER